MPTPNSKRGRVLVWGKPSINNGDARAVERFQALKDKWEPQGVVFRHLEPTSDRSTAIKLLEKVAAEGEVQVLLSYGWVINPLQPVDSELLKPLLPSLRLVTSGGAGYDHVDAQDLAKTGVWYSNTPVSVSGPTAAFAATLILSTLRQIVIGDRSIRRGEWKNPFNRGAVVPSRDPEDTTIGILGLGRIGRKTIQHLESYGFKFQYHNRRRLPEAEEQGATYRETLEDLFRTSDVISVHVPLSKATRHLISTKELSYLHPGSILVNTARGPVVDEEALANALKSGHLAAVGLDVFEHEPKIHPYLLEADNAILAPHIAALTRKSVGNIETELADTVDSFLESGTPNSGVLVPADK